MKFKKYIIESKNWYHGTDIDFTKFDKRFIGTTTDEGLLGKGFYFSTDPNIARSNKYLIEVKLNFKNPLKLSLPEWTADKKKLISDKTGIPYNTPSYQITKELKKRGYDSVILDYSKVGYKHKEIVVFDENKIKIINKSSS